MSRDSFNKAHIGLRAADEGLGELLRDAHGLRVRVANLERAMRSVSHLVPKDIEPGKPGHEVSQWFWYVLEGPEEP